MREEVWANGQLVETREVPDPPRTNLQRFNEVKAIFQSAPLAARAILMSVGTSVTTAVKEGDLELAIFLVQNTPYVDELNGIITPTQFDLMKQQILTVLEDGD